MAQLKDSLVQGSMRVTDTLYANNVNIASTTASLPLFTDTSKNIITKSITDTKTALGIAASANHADSYFVKAITSADNKIVRFDGNAGQIQTGPITISDEGYIRSYNSTRWTLDWYIFHPGASKQVAELFFDSGNATNITGGTLYWRQYSPTSTNSNTPTSFHETYNLPTVTKGLTESKSYSIITTKNLSSITAVGTITSGTWNGSAVPVANGGTGATTAANARTNLGLGSAAIYNITGGNEGYSSSATLIPRIGTDGVMEVGKYIDFHASTGTSKDYDVRITAATTGLTISGTTSGTFSGSLTGNASSATKIAAKLTATTKTYLLGTSTTITGTAANVELIGDTGVYLTTTSGELSAVKYSINSSGTEKINLQYDTTTDILNFVFV